MKVRAIALLLASGAFLGSAVHEQSRSSPRGRKRIPTQRWSWRYWKPASISAF
jgi:hypothetical protein